MPQSLRQDIINVLINVPNVNDKDGRKALFSAVLDEPLRRQIDWEGASGVFFPRLLDTLLKYDPAGQALAALLTAAKGWVGTDKQRECDALLNHLDQLSSPQAELRAVTGPRNLPPLDAHFVNRARELAQLLNDLRPGAVVTLCGPGGMGKSALAAQAAHRIEPERFPDGVFFHTFYGQPDPNLALEALALAFGVEPKPTPAIAAQQALANKRALLMLDGAEEATDLRPVLNARGQCGVLITTRRKRDALDARHDLTPLNDAHAAELLHAWGQLPPDDPNVRRICQLVGGLPLALRLIGHYLDETNETASEYLDWLTAQPFEALHRGQHCDESVYVLLERSAAQVSAAAQEALTVVGLLAFAPFAVEPVAAALDCDARAVRTALSELVDYGLLLREGAAYTVSHALVHTYAARSAENHLTPDPSPQEKGDSFPRSRVGTFLWTLLRPVLTRRRSVGGNGSDAGASERECHRPAPAEGAGGRSASATPDMLDRLAAYYTEFAREQSAQGLDGYARLDAERTHILRLLERCQAQAHWSPISALAGAIDTYLERRGYWTEEQIALNIRLNAAQQTHDRKDEGWCLNALGYTVRARGDYATTLTYLEQSLAIQREIGDRAGESTTLGNLGSLAYAQGDYESALKYYEQDIAICQEIGDRAGEAVTLNNLSQIYDARGDYATALTYLEQSLAIQREIGHRAGEGATLNNLSQIYKARGDYATALTYLEQSLAIQREIGHRAGEGTTLNNLATTAYAGGDYATALTYLEQSLAIRQEIGDVSGMCATLFNMGHIHRQNGDDTQALNTWVAVYRLAKPMHLAQALEALEQLAEQIGLPGGLDGWEALSNQLDDSDAGE